MICLHSERTCKGNTKEATKIMKTYLGEKPDVSVGLEFLCLSDGGGEVAHYELLDTISKKFNNRQHHSMVGSTLRQEELI